MLTWCAHHSTRAPQCGASLVECLIAILLFSFGVLAITALQGRAIADVGQAETRATAAMLAEQIIAHMRHDHEALNSYALNVAAADCAAGPAGGSNASSNAAVAQWLETLHASLPGAATRRQKIVVNASGRIDLLLCWQLPRDPVDHRLAISTHIS